MSLFVPYRRATLLIPSGPAHDPDRKHLFIVLTDPAQVLEHAEKYSLLVGVTSVQPDLPHDPTCLLGAGDHEFIRHRSYVHYARALIQPSQGILNGVKKGVLVPKAMLVEEIFARVDAWLKNTPIGFYCIEYAWKKGNKPKRGEFSSDFFIKQGDQIFVVEVKGDEEIADPSADNVKKHEYEQAFAVTANRSWTCCA